MTKPSAKFEFFREITPICHPALSCVEAFVRALCLKDEAVLHACFAQDPHTPFLDTLPGGVQVRSAAQSLKPLFTLPCYHFLRPRPVSS